MTHISRRFLFVCCAALLAATSARAMDTSAAYVYMTDFDTGTVLMDKQGEEQMHPSSMSKLMTTYILFKKLKSGELKLDSTLAVSEKAWRMGGSKMFVHVGDNVAVEDIIRGIVVQSGNDACIVVAEAIGGSEDGFAGMMNAEAKALGLTGSHFVNATGWPDEDHLMTPRDLAILASAIIRDFPEYYSYYSEREFTYSDITQPNRNRLLAAGIGVDGLKTGHTEVAGYGITLSAKNAETNRRVVLVINGLDSDNARVEEGGKLIRYGLEAFANKTLIKKGAAIESAPVWFGEEDSVPLAAAQDVVMTLAKSNMQDLQFSISYNSPIPTPIEAGAHIADLTITPKDKPAMTVPLVAGESVGKATGLQWWKSFIDQRL